MRRKMVYILGGDGFVGSAYVRFCQNNFIDYVSINRNNYQKYVGTKCEIFINANGNSKKYLAESDELYDFDASVGSVKLSLVDFEYELYVYLSASDVYSNCNSHIETKEDVNIDICGISKYGFHKYLGEMCVKNSASKWLIFRMGGFVGPDLIKNPIFDILNDCDLWLNINSEFQFMHTDTAAQTVFYIINAGVVNEIFNLAGTGVIRIGDVYKMVHKEPIESNSTKQVVYNISTEKINKYFAIPKSKTVVERFINSIEDNQ
jgi:nucleoside-diphosphate-sugar epimerase